MLIQTICLYGTYQHYDLITIYYKPSEMFKLSNSIYIPLAQLVQMPCI